MHSWRVVHMQLCSSWVASISHVNAIIEIIGPGNLWKPLAFPSALSWCQSGKRNTCSPNVLRNVLKCTVHYVPKCTRFEYIGTVYSFVFVLFSTWVDMWCFVITLECLERYFKICIKMWCLIYKSNKQAICR